ncbi:N-acetyltransferase [Rhodocytophaga aerolata]|uniref:N-acetyltransferase n=1 Tax=Rhodocytophaga aerolata TaxID=455078 RepID=A0ABT8QYH0_9BACT|nr:N-acetyltransferase [Rhodocytophaga aerolata]MDO1444884.1 N-acetyltransferase [Rhodocytophaga aerolata]
MMNVQVMHDKENQVFYADIQGQKAELVYKMPEESLIDFKRTFVPENLRSNEIGKQLVMAGLAYARQNNYRIITSCRFAEKYVHSQHR